MKKLKNVTAAQFMGSTLKKNKKETWLIARSTSKEWIKASVRKHFGFSKVDG